MSHSTFYPILDAYIAGLNPADISIERREVLQPLIEFLQQKKRETTLTRLNFICTHNSRRSHLGQVWAQVLAIHFDALPLETYSGGTAATVCNPRTLTALRAAGFEIDTKVPGDNPHYLIRYGGEHAGMEAWSKVYSDPANPQADFGAIMTCDSANEACPVVFGASARFAIMYEDPKAWDDTPRETEAYAERCRQIATEMYYVMEAVAAG